MFCDDAGHPIDNHLKREPPWILILDEDEEVVMTAVMLVASISGMTINPCVSVDQAQRFLEEHGAPVVAIVDLLHTGGGGIQLSTQIRALPYGNETQLLLTTPLHVQSFEGMIQRYKPFATIRKPINRRYFQLLVQEALEAWAMSA